MSSSAPPLDPIRAVRKCPAHRVLLIERYGAPYCSWQAGHFPEQWLEVDQAGKEALARPAGVDAVAAWRAAIGKTVPPRTVIARPAPATRAPRARPAAAPSRARPPAAEHVKAASSAEQGGMPVPVPKCSRCGGNGHNVRTCSEARAGSPAPQPRKVRKPRAAAAASTALALTSRVRSELEQRRDEHVHAAEEIERALGTFDLIDQIPKQHVAAARAVLEAAGADLGASTTDARQRLALTKIVAGVGTVLFAASLRSARRKQDVLEAAAAAIGADDSV